MATVGVRELKNRLSEYLRRVKAGERLVVTERGQPVAILSSPPEASWQHEVEEMLRDAEEAGDEVEVSAVTPLPEQPQASDQSPTFGIGTYLVVFGALAVLAVVVNIAIFSGGEPQGNDDIPE